MCQICVWNSYTGKVWREFEGKVQSCEHILTCKLYLKWTLKGATGIFNTETYTTCQY
jgi:hypothetical protein